ncbi:MAG: strawberry notch family protein [Bacteroidales bacterium]|nr:strawberry notch family protein [Bacteroidales bacterium]
MEKMKEWEVADTVTYQPYSTGGKIGTMIPMGMASAVENVLAQIEQEKGPVDQWMRQQLGFYTIDEMQRVLSAEQIDGVAMAIFQMGRGRGFILGDMTGVGKGRQLAALIVWSLLKGRKPVYVTERSLLFSDMYRDLNDIGCGHLRPFILNADHEAKVTDQQGNVVYDLPTRKEMEHFRLYGTLPPGYDFLMLTYSQLMRRESTNWKVGRVRNFIKDTYLLMDECHNASGDMSNVGRFFREAVQHARGVCYSSATYAKYPSSMPLYALKTAIGDAHIGAEQLIDIVAHGGPILQEELAKGLTESGCMTRRERDMSGVVRELRITTDEDAVAIRRRRYDAIIEIVQDLYDFQERFIEPYLDTLDAEAVLRQKCNLNEYMPLAEDTVNVLYERFSKRMMPIIQQLLMSTKAEDAVEATFDVLREGKKPIVQINHTMEAQLESLANVGEVLPSDEFALVMHKSLNGMLHYTVTGLGIRPSDARKHEHAPHYKCEDVISIYELDAAFPDGGAREAYDSIRRRIDRTLTGLPLSPIDYFVKCIEQAGYSVGVLTQRRLGLRLNDEDRSAICVRCKPSDKKKLAADFNNGRLDVLIGNRMMGTGISLHNSPEFEDTRQRVVITWELQDCADRQTQFDGRADRTGQLDHCHYIILSSPIPAEQRFLMMNERRQRSLNANVTANQKTDAPYENILNKYGSRVVKEYLLDHPEMAAFIPDMPDVNDEETQTDLVRIFMNSLALMSCHDQEEMLQDVLQRYHDLMEYLNENGENELVAKVMPLRATLVHRQVFAPGKDKAEAKSVFEQDAWLDELEVDVLRKPMTAAEIERLQKTLADMITVKRRIDEAKDEKVKNILIRYKQLRLVAARKLAELTRYTDPGEQVKYTPKRLETLKRQAYDMEGQNKQIMKVESDTRAIKRDLAMFFPSQIVGIPMSLFEDGVIDNAGMIDFVSIGIFLGYRIANGRLSRSNIKAVFAVNDGRRKLEIPLTELAVLDTISRQSQLNIFRSRVRGFTLQKWDSIRPKRTRETAYIVTGNILQGIARAQRFGEKLFDKKQRLLAQSKGHGHLVTYSDDHGSMCHGYLMPRIFRPRDLSAI